MAKACNSSQGNAFQMPTALVDAAPSPPVSALALVLQPNKERLVVGSVKGLPHPHQQLQRHHHWQDKHQQPALKVVLLSILPAPRTSGTIRWHNSLVVNASAL